MIGNPAGTITDKVARVRRRELKEASGFYGSVPKGLVSATRDNHGQSIAYTGRRFSVSVTIVVLQGNSPEKNAAIRALGARLIEHDADFDIARVEAARLAEDLPLAEGALMVQDRSAPDRCPRTWG